MPNARRRLGLALAGAVVVLAGFAVALVELLRFPKGAIWAVAGAAVLLVTAIRRLTR